MKGLWRREELQDFVHDPSTLIRLEEKLGVRRTIENNQLLGLRSLFILGANARKASAVVVCIIPRDYEQGPGLQLFCREIRRRAEKHDAINLAGGGLNRRIAGSSAAEAAPDYGHRFGAVRFQVVNRSQNIVLKRGFIEVRLARTGRAAESAKIDCESSKSSRYQYPCLLPPTLLIKSAAVSENNGAGALAIEIGANAATILCGERDGLLCGPQRTKGEEQEDGVKDRHVDFYSLFLPVRNEWLQGFLTSGVSQ